MLSNQIPSLKTTKRQSGKDKAYTRFQGGKLKLSRVQSKAEVLVSGGMGQARPSDSKTRDLATIPPLGDVFSHTFSTITQVASWRKIKGLLLFTNLQGK